MSELLDMDYINNLPHPLFDDDGWPIYDIDVETGLYRVDVCGLLSVKHIGGCLSIRDETGKQHLSEDLYADPDCWIERDLRAARAAYLGEKE